MAWLRGFLCVIFGSKILKNRQKTCKNATHATRNATRILVCIFTVLKSILKQFYHFLSYGRLVHGCKFFGVFLVTSNLHAP